MAEPLLVTQTDLNLDCAEFCPLSGSHSLLALGTYQLDKENATRHGRLHVSQVQQSGDRLCLRNEATLDTAGIFDMRWMITSSSRPSLAMACSDGKALLIGVQGSDGSDTLPLSKDAEAQCFPDAMATFVGLRRRDACSPCDRISAAGSNGELATLKVTPAALEVSSTWSAHELEAWTCAFDQNHADVFYSGGDDCAFKGWDVRSSPAQPIFSNRKEHGAGVCCIVPHPSIPHKVVTGSYDEKVRCWDMRTLQKPLCKTQVSTGGGVWRLRWHPKDPDLLLAACMQNGFAVLRDDGSSNLAVAFDYPHQKTLAYGADWCWDADLPIVATATFYDCTLHLWQPPI